MTADLDLLLAHLNDETAVLADAVRGLDDAGWLTATPSPGWTVADQVSHLAYFDEAAAAAVTDAVSFDAYRDEAQRLGAALPDDVAARYRQMPVAQLCSWWLDGRAAMADTLRRAPGSMRAPWYGPDLSVASMLSGRIMETWAHGQDVFDALGVPHPVTAALYDVARICARTRANSYASRGRVAPDGDIGVELVAPDTATWRFGDETTPGIRGDAVEFCLVATQRRHVEDTSLVATTDDAREWLSIAQAYAGLPGDGRAAVGSST